VRTKLLAEKAAIALRDSGHRANIFRVGFLTPDTETLTFQENADDSGFVQQLKSYVSLGVIPTGALMHSFCPVNKVSDAIMRLYRRGALASETYHLDRFLDESQARALIAAGKRCRAMEDAEFFDFLAERLEQRDVAQAATAILLHDGLLERELSTEVVTLSERTELLLRRIGFAWGDVTPEEVWSLASV
jgi:thioester reductase-like protein